MISENLMESPFWYGNPAEEWSEAIPIGNGRLGAMVFGGVQEERILLNESSVWCGGPAPTANPVGPELIGRMRELLFEGSVAEADALCRDVFLDPDPSEARGFQPLGMLTVHHDISSTVEGYRRSLDYDRAVALTRFDSSGTQIAREAFVSAVDDVIVLRYGADARGGVSLRVSLNREGQASVSADGSSLRLSGTAAALDGTFSGTKFDVLVRLLTDGGDVIVDGDEVVVVAADSLTIVITSSTDYNFSDPSAPLAKDRGAQCDSLVEAAAQRSYEELRERHIADYVELYSRSSLSIPCIPHVDRPIDERVADVLSGGHDPELLVIYYAYCRYLFISSSRPGGIAMNLQGLWNPLMECPWRSDWHLNINVQEAYWFAEQAGLPECHEPFISLLENLQPAGSEAARVMLGADGFMAGVRTDGTLFAAPAGQPVWGMYVAGGAWSIQHVMEHFRFTSDETFLRDRGLPLLRANARFWLSWLVPDPVSGLLVSGPSASPENSFVLPDGQRASIAMGNSHDQEIAWNSLRDFIEASTVLGIEDEDSRAAAEALENLALPGIAPDGRLREWSEDYVEAEPGHRHLSHLWGMMPGNRITLDGTPALARAVRASLDHRLAHDYSAQGWSLGWVACVFARLNEGDRALELLERDFFQHVWPNLFVEAHDQVQVGDMMGAPLAIIEMFLQSHSAYIDLLPSLPSSWHTGSVTGLRARGGYVVDLAWEAGELRRAVLTNPHGGAAEVRYRDVAQAIELAPGESMTLSPRDGDFQSGGASVHS